MINKDFSDFVNSNNSPSKELDEKILITQRSMLEESDRFFIIKSISIHLIAGFLTLAICPQFGWNPFGASSQIPHIFMSYGVWACGLFCGSIFMGAGSLAKLLILGRELSANKAKSFAINITLSSALVSLMMTFGIDGIEQTMYFSVSFVAFWVIGAALVDALMTNAKTLSNQLFANK